MDVGPMTTSLQYRTLRSLVKTEQICLKADLNTYYIKYVTHVSLFKPKFDGVPTGVDP